MFVITNNERNYIMYVHISPSNKRYYGITSAGCKRRWQNGNGYKTQQYFYRAIEKYGWNNFQHIVLFNNLTEDEAKLLEQCYIALYDTTDKNKGYNITDGGEGVRGYKHTEEWKQKMSKARSGANNPWYGKHLSKEHREKISMNHADMSGKNNPFYNRTHTEETRQKMRDNHYDNSGKNNHMYGKHHTKESKQKMSEAKIGKYAGKNNPKAKSIICITTNRVFFTIKEAANHYNIDESGIVKCCKGKRKNCGKLSNGTKLVWRYVNYKHNRVYRVVNN